MQHALAVVLLIGTSQCTEAVQFPLQDDCNCAVTLPAHCIKSSCHSHHSVAMHRHVWNCLVHATCMYDDVQSYLPLRKPLGKSPRSTHACIPQSSKPSPSRPSRRVAAAGYAPCIPLQCDYAWPPRSARFFRRQLQATGLQLRMHRHVAASRTRTVRCSAHLWQLKLVTAKRGSRCSSAWHAGSIFARQY